MTIGGLANHGAAGASPRQLGRLATWLVGLAVLLLVAGLPLLDVALSSRGPSRLIAVRPPVMDLDVASAPGLGDRHIAFEPAAGWEEIDATTSLPGAVAVAKSGVSFEAWAEAVGPGGCASTLDQIEVILQSIDATGTIGRARPFDARGTALGLTAPFIGARLEGLTFVVCGQGVVVRATATGAAGAMQSADGRDDEVLAMARSIEAT